MRPNFETFEVRCFRNPQGIEENWTRMPSRGVGVQKVSGCESKGLVLLLICGIYAVFLFIVARLFSYMASRVSSSVKSVKWQVETVDRSVKKLTDNNNNSALKSHMKVKRQQPRTISHGWNLIGQFAFGMRTFWIVFIISVKWLWCILGKKLMKFALYLTKLFNVLQVSSKSWNKIHAVRWTFTAKCSRWLSCEKLTRVQTYPDLPSNGNFLYSYRTSYVSDSKVKVYSFQSVFYRQCCYCLHMNDLETYCTVHMKWYMYMC